MSETPIASGGDGALHSLREVPAELCAVPARPFVLAATILASAMAFIDGTIVTIALPAIRRGLDTDLVGLQWVVNGYLLMLGALILVGGSLGDRIGRRRVFLIGIALFTAASVACAAAPTIGVLIGARAVQGIGAALLVPQSLAIIAASFPKEIRGRAIGTWAAASAVTTALGPAIGGFLIDVLSWRAAFWINVPLAAMAIWLTWRFVPESRDPAARGPIDWTGALVVTVGFGALTYGLIAIAEGATGAVVAAAAIGFGVVVLWFFIGIERRAANAVVPPELFRSRVFTGVNIVTVFLYGALSGVLFLLPFELLVRRGLLAVEAGLVMLPVGLIIGFLSRWMGILADRHGPRPFLIVGPLVFAFACLWLAIGGTSVWLAVVAPVALMATGMAIVVSPLTTAVMNAVPEARVGAASGISNAASRLAGVIAVATFGALASLIFSLAAPAGAGRFGTLPPAGDALRAGAEGAFRTAYAGVMLFGATWAFAAALAAYLTMPRAEPTKVSDSDNAP